ncbi:hypothetical protein KQI42_00200 [Tissierella sp. MSJ-40]|uniref:Uncharacterized protein n=1 Tax=Tissierella simiarum TaxID=2841534 RepID=A0ABS6E0I5_9FIRM|nr:hypothetical protein [Tissierella simiarum]MBU5436409.1 hypothetical protein [Tissierella simiarum]
MCLVLLGGTMTAFAQQKECCDNKVVHTRTELGYKYGDPVIWIINYCANCGAIQSEPIFIPR